MRGSVTAGGKAWARRGEQGPSQVVRRSLRGSGVVVEEGVNIYIKLLW